MFWRGRRLTPCSQHRSEEWCMFVALTVCLVLGHTGRFARSGSCVYGVRGSPGPHPGLVTDWVPDIMVLWDALQAHTATNRGPLRPGARGLRRAGGILALYPHS